MSVKEVSISDLRAYGYAVVVFSPEELLEGRSNRLELESYLVEKGNAFLDEDIDDEN